jgi:hypothetical protein
MTIKICLFLPAHEWIEPEYVSRYSDKIGAGKPGKGFSSTAECPD